MNCPSCPCRPPAECVVGAKFKCTHSLYYILQEAHVYSAPGRCILSVAPPLLPPTRCDSDQKRIQIHRYLGSKCLIPRPVWRISANAPILWQGVERKKDKTRSAVVHFKWLSWRWWWFCRVGLVCSTIPSTFQAVYRSAWVRWGVWRGIA